jgi:hypothetical protein
MWPSGKKFPRKTRWVMDKNRAGRRNQFIDQLSECQLRAEAERLLRDGEMPSIDTLCEEIRLTKAKFAPRIRRARREYRARISIN